MKTLAKSLLVTVLSTATLIAGSSPDYETYQINAQAKEYQEFEKTEIAAKFGNVEAQYNTGVTHLNGLKTEKNELLALYWFRAAAEAGHSGAQYYLGEFYLYGLAGIDEDTEESLKWYQMAAAQGHQLAQIMVKQLKESHVRDFDSSTNSSL